MLIKKSIKFCRITVCHPLLHPTGNWWRGGRGTHPTAVKVARLKANHSS